MKKKRCAMMFMWFSIVILAGCSSLLPSAKNDIKSPWQTFEEAKMAFDQIVPYKTTSLELKALGIDPFTRSNIKLLTYLDVIERFMPDAAIQRDALDAGVLDCLSGKESCHAYEVKAKRMYKERFGNVLADIFAFRRKTRITGWAFNAIIVLKNDVVVHKVWGGDPKLDELVDQKKPLGPLQNSEGILWDVIRF
ncbi:hypothetical protein DENIS_5168 [Desulfonema ishimotonii]|uniref:Lipoprotein n=1 Tax=Desulfonema ishimotonii TaxID=45657 RepID=A0A401G4L2_9BACT|nr:hypothetical protein [Desulfonema ishimotonii]GBC64150.1 hypothetical protein DENIS_5168 [Desulfonema ishimotonii]